MAKKKRKMSAAARKRIAAAQRKRWAAYRKGAGKRMGKRGPGRPRKSATSNNPFLNMTIEQLVTAKRQLDDAWKTARMLLR